MDERTRRFQRHDDQQEDELRLDEVLEPYEQDDPEAYDAAAPDFAPYGDAQPPYEEQPYDEKPSAYEPPYEEENQPSYGDPYDEEYSDYHEDIDETVSQAGRFRVCLLYTSGESVAKTATIMYNYPDLLRICEWVSIVGGLQMCIRDRR